MAAPWVRVFEGTPSEAAIVEAKLAESGLHPIVPGKSTATFDPHLAGVSVTTLEVLVPAAEEARARECVAGHPLDEERRS
jgi:hypothetical protein